MILSYQPTYFVTYFRYLRFFSDGTCLNFSTTDDPGTVVRSFNKNLRAKGLSIGRWELVGDLVNIWDLEERATPLVHPRNRGTLDALPVIPPSNFQMTYKLQMRCRLKCTQRGKMSVYRSIYPLLSWHRLVPWGNGKRWLTGSDYGCAICLAGINLRFSILPLSTKTHTRLFKYHWLIPNHSSFRECWLTSLWLIRTLERPWLHSSFFKLRLSNVTWKTCNISHAESLLSLFPPNFLLNRAFTIECCLSGIVQHIECFCLCYPSLYLTCEIVQFYTSKF